MLRKYVLFGAIVLVVIGFVLYALNRVPSSVSNLLDSVRPISSTNGNQQPEKTPALEINAPRGTFASYEPGKFSFIFEDVSGKNRPANYQNGDIEFSCLPEYEVTDEKGQKFSFFDAYINLAGFRLDKGNTYYPTEKYLEPNALADYQNMKMLFITPDIQGVVKGDLNGKVVFFGCK